MGALAVIWAPARTLSRVAEGQRVLPGFVVVAAYAALALVGSVINYFAFADLFGQAQSGLGPGALPPGFEVFISSIFVAGMVWSVVSPFLLWLLVSGLMQFVTRFFGGTGPFSGMLAVVGVAQMPLLVGALVQLPIAVLQILLLPETSDPTAGANPALSAVGLLSSAISLAAFLWFAVLVVVGAAFARRVGYGESAGSCAISCAGVVGLIILLIVAVVALIAIVGSLSSAGGP